MKQIFKEIEKRRCESIIEIGTYNGRQARRFAKAAFRRSPSVTYHGFDLFELCTSASLNPGSPRKPPSVAEVDAFLEALRKEYAFRPLWLRRDFKYELHQGFSGETLAVFRKSFPQFRADVILIDGGHHVDVIAEDWRHSVELLAPGGVIYLDDYYDRPRFPGEYGANTLAEQLASSPEWKVDVLPVVDIGNKNTGIRVVRAERR
jgi:predicted O-methyltransferase YrrM